MATDEKAAPEPPEPQADETPAFTVEQALLAIKVGSFAIFVAFIQALVLALTNLLNPITGSRLASSMDVIAVLLFIAAIRMRGGHASWTPWAWIAIGISVQWNAIACYAMVRETFTIYSAIYIALTSGAMVYSIWSVHRSLRWWHWLRFQGVKTSY